MEPHRSKDGMISRHCRALLALVLLTALLPTAVRAQAGGQRSLAEMLRLRAEALRQQVLSVDREIADVASRVPRLESEIDRLVEEIASIEVPPEQEEPEEVAKAPPREVRFRPPLLRTNANADTPIALVCQNGRVAILDMEQSERELNALVENQVRRDQLIRDKACTVEAGDFLWHITLIIRGSDLALQQKVARKPGQAGETAEQALRAGSRIQSRLSRINSENAVIQFAVYPDSFEEFRLVRRLMWDKGYGINWLPMKHGAEINVGSGAVQQQ